VLNLAGVEASLANVRATQRRSSSSLRVIASVPTGASRD
jgi:hypothetical protein